MEFMISSDFSEKGFSLYAGSYSQPAFFIHRLTLLVINKSFPADYGCCLNAEFERALQARRSEGLGSFGRIS